MEKEIIVTKLAVKLNEMKSIMRRQREAGYKVEADNTYNEIFGLHEAADALGIDEEVSELAKKIRNKQTA